jgi:hypothetical protein
MQGPGVVHTGLPEHVLAQHALVADQDVLQRVVERVPHMQRAGDVRRRDHDGGKALDHLERIVGIRDFKVLGEFENVIRIGVGLRRNLGFRFLFRFRFLELDLVVPSGIEQLVEIVLGHLGRGIVLDNGFRSGCTVFRFRRGRFLVGDDPANRRQNFLHGGFLSLIGVGHTDPRTRLLRCPGQNPDIKAEAHASRRSATHMLRI